MRKRKLNEKFSDNIDNEFNEKISKEKLSNSTLEHCNNADIPDKSSDNNEKGWEILSKSCFLLGATTLIFISTYAIFKVPFPVQSENVAIKPNSAWEESTQLQFHNVYNAEAEIMEVSQSGNDNNEFINNSKLSNDKEQNYDAYNAEAEFMQVSQSS